MGDNDSSKQGNAPELKLIDSLDSKIIQYQYGIRKLTLLISSFRAMSERKDATLTLPMVQYVALMGGSVFAINEAFTQSRIEALSSFKPVKVANLSISNATMHIPYDISDRSVTPLSEIPSVETGDRCLKLLTTLCFSCLQGYQKRLQQAKIERERVLPSGTFFNDMEYYINQVILSDDDFDTKMDDGFILRIPDDASITKDPDYVDTTLADMDIKMLPLLVSSWRKILTRLKTTLSKFRNLRNIAKLNQDKYLMRMPQWQYTLHRLFAIAMRLNDIYTVVRKMGRKIYLSNAQHLRDPLFLSHFQNFNFFKQILHDMEELFNGAKRNGMFVATITRFIRQNARHEVNVKNVLDFVNHISQGHMMLEMTVTKMQEFGSHWIPSEIKFREFHSLPKSRLIELNNSMASNERQEAKSTPVGGLPLYARSNKMTTANSSLTSRSSIHDSKEQLKSLSHNVKSSESNSQNTSARTSRRSSITSTNSNDSVPTLLDNDSNIKRPSSIDNRISPGRTIPKSRPNSAIFLNSNSSSSESVPGSSNAQEHTKGRRRSNSNPLDTMSIPEERETAASGAAAAALAKRNSVTQISNQPSRKTVALNFNSNSNAPNINNRHSITSEAYEKDNGKNSKVLTANQRLHKHLRSASKSGQLMTQAKETFSTVVFDPNHPDAVKLKRNAEKHTEVPTTEDTHAKQPIKEPVSRSRMTKLNTQKNSLMTSPQVSENSESTAVSPSSISSVSLGKSEAYLPTKKVRFTGVPEYTEAEDAPTKYSNKILKSFAVFKSPIVIPKTTFKSRDEMFKREESLSLKAQALK